jgi:riboflavin synthase alpha subunit
MNPKSYPQLQEKFGGKFIARINGRVIASAKTSKALWDKVRNRIGDPKMVIGYIPPKGAICIYGISYSGKRDYSW